MSTTPTKLTLTNVRKSDENYKIKNNITYNMLYLAKWSKNNFPKPQPFAVLCSSLSRILCLRGPSHILLIGPNNIFCPLAINVDGCTFSHDNLV